MFPNHFINDVESLHDAKKIEANSTDKVKVEKSTFQIEQVAFDGVN